MDRIFYKGTIFHLNFACILNLVILVKTFHKTNKKKTEEKTMFTFASGYTPEYYLKLLKSLSLMSPVDLSFSCLQDLIRVNLFSSERFWR